jgi:hypothetical protein
VTAAFLIPLLPTLLWWWETGSWIYLRGWINLEYLVLLGIAFLFPSWGMITLLTVEMCIALVEPIAHLYYFSIHDALFSIRYLRYIPVHRLIGYVCLLLVYALVSAAILRVTLGDHRRKCANQLVCALLVCGLLAGSADLFLGRFHPLLHLGPQLGDVDVHRVRIIRAPIASILIGVYLWHDHVTIGPSTPLTSSLSKAIAEIPAGNEPDIVLVLTESWGLANDDRVNQAQMQPYRNPAIGNLYRVQTGSVAFVGATTSGETRELCGNSEGNFSLFETDVYFDLCWPARLKSSGYHTLAVHGFTPGMFRRGEWYQRFGFEDSAFLPDLKRDGAAMCDGSFPGICDEDVAQWIGDWLLAHSDGRPDFVHWVTLNSHLPVPQVGKNLSLQQCAAVGIDRQQSLCSWFMLVFHVHQSVASLALRPGLRPTVFVIVGDHAPPFMRAATRNQFSQTRVPFVMLVPRSIPLRALGSKPAQAAAISSAN